MPELKKPDMLAVLQRTNLTRHVGGFLLPVFEAVSNSIHSITDKYGAADVQKFGKIRIRVNDPTEEDKFFIEIVDNGKGLDENNFEAFITPYTGNKLRKNGKGFGRFIAFKVFSKVGYESLLSGSDETVRFNFDIYRDEEVTFLNGRSEFPFDEGCLVRYAGVRDEYENRWVELDEAQFLNQLTQNFLTYLVNGSMPETKVVYNGNETDLRDHFLAVFKYEETHEFSLTLENENYDFKLDVARVAKGDPFNRHALLFFADNRILGRGRAIEGKLGRAYFERDDGSQYVVIAAVSGSYLDQNANNDRTFLEASEKDVVEIVDKACELILSTEKEQNEVIKTEQRDEVVAVLQTHPLLRFGLSGKTVAEYVEKKPNNWNRERFVSDLAVQRFREERKWAEYVRETVSDENLYNERREKLLQKVTGTYRDALAEYVIHRKAVIEIADQLRRFDESRKMAPEDEIHSLIFPRMRDSKDTRYYQHNLWLLDERLAFVSYASSDRTFHGGRRASGDKIMDINFYDEVYVAGGAGTSAVMVVEFKRPGRDDYSLGRDGSDPVKQVNDTVKQMRAQKRFVTSDGVTIPVPDNTPITAFIIADLEPKLMSLADEYDFVESWDKQYLFKYHDKFDVYTEIFGYDKLITDAKRRNAAFFDVLLNEVGT